MSRRKIMILSLVGLLTIVGFFYFFSKQANAPQQEQSNQNPKSPAKQPERIRLIANGDLLPHDSINQQAKTSSGYDYKPFFSEVSRIYDAADISFCNQESPSGGEELGISGYPVFNAPTQFAKDISAVGCNVINLANNHMNDKGAAGIAETRQVWDSLKPLAVSGANRSTAEQNKVQYFEIKGVKFAFVAYAEYSNNASHAPYELNILSQDLVNRQITEANKKADIVLVSAHWGTEYSQGINEAQDKWSKTFASLGADIVFGTGPHVLEPVKRLPREGGKETIVYYSLGNLLSTQLDIESLIGGFAVIDIDAKTKKVMQIGFLPTYMHYEWTAQAKAREDLLSRRNLKIYPLASATDALARSQNQTTVKAQKERVSKLLNTYTRVNIYDSLPD